MPVINIRESHNNNINQLVVFEDILCKICKVTFYSVTS